jgi:peptide/nickel transport system substrate-binding protein
MFDKLNNLTQTAKNGGLSRRDFLNRAAALGIAAPFAASLFTAQTAQASTPIKGGNLVMGISGGASTDSSDPALITGYVSINYGQTWGEKLFETNPSDNSIVPVLAESYEVNKGAQIWVLNIRRGVTFHNGKALDANDVVKTLQRHSGTDTKSGALGIMKGIKSITQSAPYQVTIELHEGNSDLPYLLTDYHLLIQPNGGFDQPEAAIGTGPYKVESAEHGVRYFMTKYPDHWRTEVGHVDSVEILIMNDKTARVAALKSGKVHLINQVDPKIANLLKRSKDTQIINTPSRGYYGFVAHTDKPPYDNNDLRLALKYAVDREDMVSKVLHGYGTVGNDFPINNRYPFFPDDIEQRTYDLDKAAFHFKKSGFDGTVSLSASDVAFPGGIDAALLYQQHASKAGIKIQVQREPNDGYWSNVWNTKAFSAVSWGGRPVQDLMYSVAYLGGADWNDSKLANAKFDQLLKQTRVELDEDKRTALYREMALLVKDDGGNIIPMFTDFIDGVSIKVGGYVPDPTFSLSGGYAAVRCWLS